MTVSFPQPPLRDWKFDLAIKTRANDPFLVRGNLANGAAAVDLKLGGTGLAPYLEGSVRIEQFKATLPFSTLTVTRGFVVFHQGRALPALARSSGRIAASAITSSTPTSTARATEPQVQLNSEPPLPYADIVSLLATGTTVGELGGSADVLASRAAMLAVQQLYRKIFKRKGAPAADPRDRRTRDVSGSLPSRTRRARQPHRRPGRQDALSHHRQPLSPRRHRRGRTLHRQPEIPHPFPLMRPRIRFALFPSAPRAWRLRPARHCRPPVLEFAARARTLAGPRPAMSPAAMSDFMRQQDLHRGANCAPPVAEQIARDPGEGPHPGACRRHRVLHRLVLPEGRLFEGYASNTRSAAAGCCIRIAEGPRSLLQQITFIGNASIPDATLYEYMIGATPERLARDAGAVSLHRRRGRRAARIACAASISSKAI